MKRELRPHHRLERRSTKLAAILSLWICEVVYQINLASPIFASSLHTELLHESEIKTTSGKHVDDVRDDEKRQFFSEKAAFPIDSSTKSFFSVPKGWPDPRTQPRLSLELGIPPRVEIPTPRLNLPIFLLPYPIYIEGDGALISEINLATRYWAKGNLVQAEIFFEKALATSTKSPLGSLEWSLARIMAGYFYLHLSSTETLNFDKTQLEPTEFGKIIWDPEAPPTPKPAPSSAATPLEGNIPVKLPSTDLAEELASRATEHRNKGANLLFYATSKLDASFFDQNPSMENDDELYFDFVKNGIFFLKNKTKWGTIEFQKSNATTKNALNFVQSTAIFSLWNTFELKRNAWTQNFKMGDILFKIINKKKLTSQLQLQLKEKPTLLASPESYPMRSGLYLYPRFPKDFLSALLLIQAEAHLIDRNLYHFFLSLSQSIQAANSLEFIGIAFEKAAIQYFSLGNLRQAQRYFGYAVASSSRFQSLFPLSTFSGAETLFWRGDFQKSLQMFYAFQEAVGDPDYAPWLRLRVAEIEDLSRKQKSDNDLTEWFEKTNTSHALFPDVLVRQFCHEFSNLSDGLLEMEIKKVTSILPTAREGLKNQAGACLLRAELLIQKKNFKTEQKTFTNEIKEQIASLERFETSYPESDYKKLFEDRKNSLEIAPLIDAVNNKKCGPILNKFEEYFEILYKQSQKPMKTLPDTPKKKDEKNPVLKNFWSGKNYHPLLNWEDKETQFTYRCAVLMKNKEAIKKLSHLIKKSVTVDKKFEKLHGANLAFVSDNSARNATKLWRLYKSIQKNEWFPDLTKFIDSPNVKISSENFWLEVSVLHLFLFNNFWDRHSIFYNDLLKHVKTNIDLVFDLDEGCYLGVENFESLNKFEIHKIMRSKGTQFWMDRVLKQEGSKSKEKKPIKSEELSVKASSKCLDQLGNKVISYAMEHPTSETIQKLILPYLNQLDMADSETDWLVFLNHAEQGQILKTFELKNYYEKILAKSADKRIQEFVKLKLLSLNGLKSNWPLLH